MGKPDSVIGVKTESKSGWPQLWQVRLDEYLSATNTLDGLAEFIVDAFKQVFIVDVELGCLAKELLLDPLFVHEHLLPIEVTNVRIHATQLSALVKLHRQVYNLADVSLSLILGLLCHPRGSLHELLALHSFGGEDVLSASESAVKLLVLLDEQTALALNFVVGERCLHLKGCVVVGGAQRMPIALA